MISQNSNIAEIIGLSFGDGGLTERKNTDRLRFQLRGSLSEDKKHYDNYIIHLFNKEVMNPLFQRNVGIVFNKNKSFYGISVESNKLKILNKLGIPIGPKKELYIPTWIKKNKGYTKRFLRGLFDTDGSVFCQKNYTVKDNKHTQIKIKFLCCSKNLMKEVYNILNRFEIKTSFKKNKKTQKPHWSKSYIAKIDGNINVEKWFNLIGSKNPRHITRYQIWKKFGFCPPYTTLKEREKILKGKLNPYSYYQAGVPEWSNGHDFSKRKC